MMFQVLLAIGKYQMYRGKSRELLYHQVHLVMMTQELQNIMRNVGRVAGECLRSEGPLSQVMTTFPHLMTTLRGSIARNFPGITSSVLTWWVGYTSVYKCSYTPII